MFEHGRPIRLKDKIPWKSKTQEMLQNEINTPKQSLPTNQIIEIGQSNSIGAIDPSGKKICEQLKKY